MKHKHFFISLGICILTIYFQSYFFAMWQSEWMKVDLLIILMCYFAMERVRWEALTLLCVSTFLVSGMSAAPLSLYWTLHVFILIGAIAVLRFILVRSLLSQFLFFISALGLKVTLHYFYRKHNFDTYSFSQLILQIWPGLLTTILAMPIVFSALALFDKKYAPPKTRSGRIEVTF